MSPFDLAAAQPILGQPSRKKWMPSFGATAATFVSSSNWNVIASSAPDASTESLADYLPVMSPNKNDVVAITFSHRTNIECFDAFDDIDIESSGPMGTNGTSPPPSSFGIDKFYVPPLDRAGTGRMSELSLDSTVNSTGVEGSTLAEAAMIFQ